MKSFIKNIISYIFHTLKKNRYSVKSPEVSIKASIGYGVEILKQTSIDSNSRIGNCSFIGKNCNISKSSIGNYCSIANNVSIGMGEHDIHKISTSAIFLDDPYSDFTKHECIIEHDVWIGTESVILRGVTVSTGAVIGANSVVTKDIPPYAVAVGSPARVIKYRFDNEKIERILKSKWWEKEPQEAKNIIAELENG